ncbi:hypothetical protein [Bacillus infantis]|uniref:hypothetical protein n=1 Tax=Bacillus infantis TaxID=324767 RepID=UPI00209FAA5E|nr:hypothetical protein [Bacillus infantis]MCP1159263.1 hypothetical protein [Bacillus infantis]
MTAATQTKKLEKGLLIKILRENLNWSECYLKSFTEDSLNDIYDYILDGYLVAKAKTKAEGTFRIPKKVQEALNIKYGDYYDIKINLHRKEIILYKGEKNRIKVGVGMMVCLPYRLIEKNLIKGSDDTMVLVKGDKIVLKSFSYMQ